jgi:broad-specificity NMP kinase
MEATTLPAPKKFKFCYIMRGLPGSGKSTVAQQLAGPNGRIFTLDKTIVDYKHSLLNEEMSVNDIYDKNFEEFCDEINKGTEIIVVDHTNLMEWEYSKFVNKAQ